MVVRTPAERPAHETLLPPPSFPSRAGRRLQRDRAEARPPIPTSGEASVSKAAAPKPAPAPKAKKPKKPTLKELETQLATLKKAKVEARREARYAQAELEIGRQEPNLAGGGREATRKARMGLEKARKAMEAFDQVERPLAVRKTAFASPTRRIACARRRRISRGSRTSSPRRSRPARSRRSCDVADVMWSGRASRLQITAAEVDHERETKLPAKMSELADGVRSAEASLAQAEQRAQRGRLRAALDVEKATDDLDDARRASKEADGKVKSKERQVREAKAAAKGSQQKSTKGKDSKEAKAKSTKSKGAKSETTMSEDVEGKGGA